MPKGSKSSGETSGDKRDSQERQSEAATQAVEALQARFSATLEERTNALNAEFTERLEVLRQSQVEGQERLSQLVRALLDKQAQPGTATPAGQALPSGSPPEGGKPPRGSAVLEGVATVGDPVGGGEDDAGDRAADGNGHQPQPRVRFSSADRGDPPPIDYSTLPTDEYLDCHSAPAVAPGFDHGLPRGPGQRFVFPATSIGQRRWPKPLPLCWPWPWPWP